MVRCLHELEFNSDINLSNTGPAVRISPTLLLVSDPKKLPEIYHRNVDKTGHYITGSFGETESLFNMRSHKTHAAFRKRVAGPVSLNAFKSKTSNLQIDPSLVQLQQHQENGTASGCQDPRLASETRPEFQSNRPLI